MTKKSDCTHNLVLEGVPLFLCSLLTTQQQITFNQGYHQIVAKVFITTNQYLTTLAQMETLSINCWTNTTSTLIYSLSRPATGYSFNDIHLWILL